MSHERLRKFNTRDSYPEQQLDNDLCQVVMARGAIVFLRGQVGQDLRRRASVAIGDAAGQAEQAMANVAAAARRSRRPPRGRLQDHDLPDRPALPRAGLPRPSASWLKGVFPVSTGLVVSALARPEWLVEIDVIAVIPEQRRRRSAMTFSIAALDPQDRRARRSRSARPRSASLRAARSCARAPALRPARTSPTRALGRARSS